MDNGLASLDRHKVKSLHDVLWTGYGQMNSGMEHAMRQHRYHPFSSFRIPSRRR